MSKLKQAFYENHSGSTIMEINRITISILLGHALFIGLKNRGLVKTKLDQYSWEFACYVFNVLLATTVYSSRHRDLLLIYGIPACSIMLWNVLYPHTPAADSTSSATIPKSKIQRESNKIQSVKKKVPFLSIYRATMMITTLICILAVDLPMFPRRYAKSETWGTSLMDLGVGSFVFSSGLVTFSTPHGFIKGLQQGGIVLVMGVVRALMVRGSGYHEHASEYGTHWNFFITLALLPPLLPGFRRVQKLGIPFVLQGFIICAAYQVALVQTKWQYWIIMAPRQNLISANKEGLSSFIGYIAIFLFGLDAGSIVLAKKTRPILFLLLISSIVYMTGYFFVTGYFGLRVSRRIANSPYIMWVAGHNTSFLFLLALFEKIPILLFPKTGAKDDPHVPRLLERINAQGLYIFLGANLMTGAINLAMGDAMMNTSKAVGMAIMLGYTLSICLAAFFF